MGRRWNHYEAAFEGWLRAARLPYVLVDEQRRSLVREGSLKSLDFIVSADGGERLLVDVKGRRFPSGGAGSGQTWINWTHDEDLRHMGEWEQIFGVGFRALLVFAYDVDRPERYPKLAPYFEFLDRYYSFHGVWVDQYRDRVTVRSPSWETVNVSAGDFRRLRFPLNDLLPSSSSLSVVAVS